MTELFTLNPGLWVVVAGIFGLLVGSFLNVVIHRLPRMMQTQWEQQAAELRGEPALEKEKYTLVTPRSACPSCGHQIKSWENIPIVSWLFLRGKCSSCKTPISARYPIVEFITGALCAAAAWKFGWGPASLASLVFIFALVALTGIDIDTQLLPDDITLPLLWAGLLGFCWRWKALRLAVLTLTLLVIVGLNLPGRHPDKQALRERYIHALRSYEGIRYVWGGENRLGIDCSGLVRVGLINANFREGLETLNPGLMRAGLSLWWQDCSARALGEENRQFARHLFEAPAINRLDQTQLQPGDFAVTDDGAHVMVCLGASD